MAYRRRRSRSRSFGRRTGSKLSKLGVNLSLPFLGGVLLGFTNLDNKLPQELVLGAAVAPINGIGMIKGAAQGVVLGNIIQKYTGGFGEGTAGFGI